MKMNILISPLLVHSPPLVVVLNIHPIKAMLRSEDLKETEY